MAKKKESFVHHSTINILIVVVAVVLLLTKTSILERFGDGNDYVTNTTMMSMLNQDTSYQTSDCRLTSDHVEYCAGEQATITLYDGANNVCTVFANINNEGWHFLRSIVTNSNGVAMERGVLSTPGNAKIRVYCDNGCLTNLLSVDVVNCDDSNDDCWWQEIDSYSGSIPSASDIYWSDRLVSGSFKFTWDYGSFLTTGILSGSSVIQTYDSANGDHEFTSSSNQEWGLGVRNVYRSPVSSTIKLYQWVCEGDNFNWGVDMFGHYSTVDKDELCYDYCYEQQISFGGYYTGDKDDCYGQNNIYVLANGCCCYNAPA